MRLLARISEFYRHALGADPGYNGVLTHNPMRSAHRHGEFLTHWGCNRPYSLSELAEPIPRGWRLPVKPTTEAGRNCALFVALMKWAGSPANIGREAAKRTLDGEARFREEEVSALIEDPKLTLKILQYFARDEIGFPSNKTSEDLAKEFPEERQEGSITYHVVCAQMTGLLIAKVIEDSVMGPKRSWLRGYLHGRTHTCRRQLRASC